MGIYATKAKWQSGLQPVVELCARHCLHPDIFTYSALALSGAAAFALCAAGSNRAWLWFVPVCVMVRLLCNLLDGMIARELRVASAWGEVKNEFGDRVADAALFLGLTFGGYVDARLGALVISLVPIVSYLGILGKAIGGARIYSGVFGKGDRMISLALFTLCPLSGGDLATYNVYLAFAALAALVTILQRLKVIYVSTKSAC